MFYFPEKFRHETKDRFAIPAMDLFNRRAGEMKGSEILGLIPTTWSLDAIYPALTTMISTTTDKVRFDFINLSLFCKTLKSRPFFKRKAFWHKFALLFIKL